MASDFKPVLDLIGHIYEAAIDPSHWSRAIERLVALTRSKSGALFIYDGEMRKQPLVYGHGIPKLIMALHSSPLWVLDPALKVMRNQPQGKAVNMYSLNDVALIPRLVLNILPKATDAFYFGGVNCFNTDDWHVGIGLHRTKDTGEYDPETLALVEDLVPHFQRALRIQREFMRLRLDQQKLRTELDRHIMGIVMLDEQMRVVYSNPMARQIMERHGAIGLRNEVLQGYNGTENEQLQKAIAEAMETLPDTINGCHALRLSHPEHEHPLAVLVAPAKNAQSSGNPLGEPASVTVYLSDPETSSPISDDALMEVYGLTAREARVAIAIANGRSISDIAVMHHVTEQTVRTQLKSVFHKTGVNRQVDLIRLLLVGPYMYNG